MEIDLIDAEARLAVELDGPQHLADPEATAVTGARTFSSRKTVISLRGGKEAWEAISIVGLQDLIVVEQRAIAIRRSELLTFQV